MRLSVVTATRNRPDWIARCVASVQAQTFGDFEHVIYDVSDTPIRGLLPDDQRIRYVRGDAPRGVVVDWNIAWGLARGAIVTALSDDDQLAANALETVAARIGEAEWLVAQTVILDEHGNPICYRGGTQASLDETMARDYMLGGAIYFRPSLLERVGGLNDAYEGAADVDLYMRFARAATPVLITDVLYLYTDHPGTDSRVRADHQRQQVARIYADARAGRQV